MTGRSARRRRRSRHDAQARGAGPCGVRIYGSDARAGERARAWWISHGKLSRACPVTLAGARVLTTAEAETLWRAGAGVFIDVLPRAPKPQNLPTGTIWRDRPRLNIPGSIWLPDAGYGKLAEATEDYLRRGLERASGGNNAALLVIYCQENCWMSWNAAKRVLSYGYPNVAWYPDGTEGWERANLPMAESQPEPRADEDKSSPR